MGLDIYLFHVSKNEALREGQKYNMQELEKKYPYLHTISVEEKLCESIKNVATKIIGTEQVFDADLVGKYAKVENVKYLHQRAFCQCPNDEDGFTLFEMYDEDKNSLGEVKIPYNDFSKVLAEHDFEYYAFDLEEIDYQRKGLNDLGWSLMPENCEYDDSKERVKRMCEEGGLSGTFIDNWIDGETVLWCWW